MGRLRCARSDATRGYARYRAQAAMLRRSAQTASESAQKAALEALAAQLDAQAASIGAKLQTAATLAQRPDGVTSL